MKVLITGATRGIGNAIVQELAGDCEAMTIHALHDPGLEKLSSQLRMDNPSLQVETLTSDLDDLEETRTRFRDWSLRQSELDALILVAGTFADGTLTEISDATFESTLRINLLSASAIIQETLGLLKNSRSPKIVIVGSTAAYEDYPLVPSYGVAKWALRSYASNLRLELRNDGVGVTFISPGGTLTDMWAGEELPPHRLLEPRDTAVLVRASLALSSQAVVEELIVRPILGDIHE